MNFSGTGVLRTSAVGSFPGGATTYGNEEMSGNVWEWTRSLWEDYPYPPPGPQRKQREDLTDGGDRVLRGGAFYLDQYAVRCAARLASGPVFRFNDLGFRVVVSPLL